MLSVTLNKIGKRFGREWIFRNVNYQIPPGTRLAILGGNGSGKSTLLQIISGFVTASEGGVQYLREGKPVDETKVHRLVSLASPYLQLTEDFTGMELLQHLRALKPFRKHMSAKEVLHAAYLDTSANKLIRNYSSGMKQRLKLALAILADTPLVLLDEPASNLDSGAMSWYRKMVDEHCGNRTVVVCSNAIDAEFAFCEQQLRLADYK